MHTDDTGRTSQGTRKRWERADNASCKRSVFRMRTRVSTRRWAHRNWFPALSQRASPPSVLPGTVPQPEESIRAVTWRIWQPQPGSQTDRRAMTSSSSESTSDSSSWGRSSTFHHQQNLFTAGAHWDNRYYGTTWTDHLQVSTNLFPQNLFIGE